MSLFQYFEDFPELLPPNRNFNVETLQTAADSTLTQKVFCCPVCRSRFLHLTSFIVCCANHLPFPINLNGSTDDLERDFTLLDVKPELSEGYETLYEKESSTRVLRESFQETESLVKKFKIIVKKLYLPGILKNDWIYVQNRVKKDISWKSEDRIKTESISSNNNNDFDEKFSEIAENTETKETKSYFIKQEEIPNVPQFQGSKYIFGVYSERRYKKIKESKKNGKISRRKVKKEELSEEEDESLNFLRPKKNYYKDESKTCKICGKSRTKSNIRRHVAGHCAEEDDLDCKMCFATHTAPNKLREHYSRVHQVKFREFLYNMQKERIENGSSILNDSVTCTVCYTNMKTESDLKYHYEMLHSYKEGGGKSKGTLECNICGKTFAAVQNRNLHIRRIHKQIPDGSVFCHYCGKDFVTKGFLLSHFRNLHFDEKGEFKSSVEQTTKKRYKHPPKQANTEEIAKHYMHYKVHSICEICGLIKESRFALMRHRYEKHGVIDSGYSKIIDRDREENDCSVCGKHFTSIRKWKDHEKYHQKEQANLFCQVCGAKCKTITYLKSHMLRHGEKQFVCDFEGCGKSFAVKHDVKIHKRRAHCDDLDYICKICGAPFRTWNYRRYHEETVHGLVKVKQQPQKKRNLPSGDQNNIQMETNNAVIEILPSNQSSFGSLDSTIVSNSSFNEVASNVFSETGKHDCQYCGKQFDDYKRWQSHEYYHKKVNSDLPCPTCGIKCKTVYYLKTHSEKCQVEKSQSTLHHNQNFQEIPIVVVPPQAVLCSYGANIQIK